MHPSVHARERPDQTAVVMEPSGRRITYGELERRSNQVAQFLRSLGLKHGDAIALCVTNAPQFFEIVWGAERAGLYFTPMSTHLTAGEMAYIVGDCGARLFIASSSLDSVSKIQPLLPSGCRGFYVGAPLPGFDAWDAAIDKMPTTAIADESPGLEQLYSSGTTGRPKGIRNALPAGPLGQDPGRTVPFIIKRYGFNTATTYLSPAPLYHAAPLRYCMGVHRLGGCCIVMEKFEPELALQLIERHKVTHSQWVPTMFVRMLKLPEDVRHHYNLSSMRVAIHAAAPCPVDIKKKMLAWWGPVVHEYYGGSEGVGVCAIGPEEWISHEGSVGKCVNAVVHIVDDDGSELPPGKIGTVYFESNARFSYHNDSEKTKTAYNDKGWATLGDIGRIDEEGFLYLTDRKAFMIISGGVNIYPQEVEDHLLTHPDVLDVAVIGVPNPDFGEEVKAIVQLANPDSATTALREELITYCRGHLSHIKCPRSVDFMAELPRYANGKLYKRLLRDRYWPREETGNGVTTIETRYSP